MKPTSLSTETLDDLQRSLRAAGTPYALATVTRTFDATSASPGSKAVLNADGEILEGWVGGGCARGAIARAAKTALARAEPVLVALRPDDKLAEVGVEPCELRDGMVYERALSRSTFASPTCCRPTANARWFRWRLEFGRGHGTTGHGLGCGLADPATGHQFGWNREFD